MTNSTPIYENSVYYIVIGQTEHADSGQICYKCINKETGVVEFESSVISQVLHSADEYARQLKSFWKDKVGETPNYEGD